MNRTRLVVSLLTAGALFLALALIPASVGAQTMAERSREAKKIKEQSTRKVWTNEDLQQLQGGRVNVVGTSLKKPEAAVAPAGQPAAPQQPAATNFYADLTMEEREQWIAKLEQEISEAETALVEQRSRALTAPTEEERAAARANVEKLERAVEANRVEIELIRNTPPPKPVKPAAKPGEKPKPAPAAPSAPSPS